MTDRHYDEPTKTPTCVFLTDAELARRRRQSVRTLQRQRAAGDAPPSVKVGRRRLTRLDWVEAHEAAALDRGEGGQ
jgi:hypothetical protein